MELVYKLFHLVDLFKIKFLGGSFEYSAFFGWFLCFCVISFWYLTKSSSKLCSPTVFLWSETLFSFCTKTSRQILGSARPISVAPVVVPLSSPQRNYCFWATCSKASSSLGTIWSIELTNIYPIIGFSLSWAISEFSFKFPSYLIR